MEAKNGENQLESKILKLNHLRQDSFLRLTKSDIHFSSFHPKTLGGDQWINFSVQFQYHDYTAIRWREYTHLLPGTPPFDITDIDITQSSFELF